MKLLEENIDETPQNIHVGDDFLDKTSRAQVAKPKLFFKNGTI